MGRAVCHERSGLAGARGLGSRAVKEGVDAGAETVRSEVLIAPRGARECPYNAHLRILSASVVPDGLQGWLAGPVALRGARMLP